jgi:hypothetical protein
VDRGSAAALAACRYIIDEVKHRVLNASAREPLPAHHRQRLSQLASRSI